jgi:transcriptional regulator with XRE-family HTH domain
MTRKTHTHPAPGTADQAGEELASRFGRMVRERRERFGMRQDELALAAGVGRRFVIELERGKPGCQLGKALLVANALGLRPFDPISEPATEDAVILPDLPDATEP